VQTFQHIPDFPLACQEAWRVLRHGGRFACYSLHATPVAKLVYWLAGKPYHLDGPVEGAFHLARASEKQKHEIARIFSSTVEDRYTECLFHPDFRLAGSGKKGSVLGRVDCRLSDFPFIGRWIARQRSFMATKTS
jgi:hypothetical protein